MGVCVYVLQGYITMITEMSHIKALLKIHYENTPWQARYVYL